MENKIREASALIRSAKHVTAFTGAGISVESGIPPFRGDDGLWSRYDPSILDISRYLDQPGDSWPVIKELFYGYFQDAKPNLAHYFLAELEQKKILKALVTQNIDHLHQDAGSRDVIMYHGNSDWMICTVCGERTRVTERVIQQEIPRCRKDHGLLKPDFIFFGEPIPALAVERSIEEARRTDVMLVIGTTGEIMPASLVPHMAKDAGAMIIEINPVESLYTDNITDIFLKGKATEICNQLKQFI